MVARRGDAPAKWINTKLVGWRRMRRQMKRPKWQGTRRPNGTTPNWSARWGMRRPNETTPNRWRLGGECAGQMEEHQIGGGSAGNAPAKWNNTNSVARRRMRRQTKRLWHDDGMRPKRMRRGFEMRRLNEKIKAWQRMHRPNKKWRRGDGMHRPNKETATR